MIREVRVSFIAHTLSSNDMRDCVVSECVMSDHILAFSASPTLNQSHSIWRRNQADIFQTTTYSSKITTHKILLMQAETQISVGHSIFFLYYLSFLNKFSEVAFHLHLSISARSLCSESVWSNSLDSLDQIIDLNYAIIINLKYSLGWTGSGTSSFGSRFNPFECVNFDVWPLYLPLDYGDYKFIRFRNMKRECTDF